MNHIHLDIYKNYHLSVAEESKLHAVASVQPDSSFSHELKKIKQLENNTVYNI